jgi:8-oxo-dGTP pyrophosphatase MutT (NUDIX family)
MTRDFTVAVFVISQGHVLMHQHKTLGMWLPPGGHIEPAEIPDDAAVREVWEETGTRIRLVGERALPVDYPRQLVIPRGIQVEDIRPGHQHIDLVYYGEPLTPLQPIPPALFQECQVAWYSREELASLDLTAEIGLWCEQALAFFEGLLARAPQAE